MHTQQLRGLAVDTAEPTAMHATMRYHVARVVHSFRMLRHRLLGISALTDHRGARQMERSSFSAFSALDALNPWGTRADDGRARAARNPGLVHPSFNACLR